MKPSWDKHLHCAQLMLLVIQPYRRKGGWVAHQRKPAGAAMSANPRPKHEAAEQGDYSELDRLMGVLRHPAAPLSEAQQHYTERPPAWGCNLNLSCSS